MNYRTMTVDDIISWCQENNQVEWLKETAKKTVEKKVYPKVTKDGKKVLDKTVEPTIKMVPISFIELKLEFVNKFMPELAPVKKSMNFRDKIANL